MRLFLIILMGSLIGCSTMRESLVVGAGSGAATGAIGAASIADKNKGQAAVQGALIGGLIGGVASYFLHKGLDKRDQRVRRETLFNLEKFDVSSPMGRSGSSSYGHGITKPRVEAQWIDTQVKDKKLIEGHRVWVITEDPEWIPNIKGRD